ncbi:MAG: NAD(P)/FAD-dependent oxidoreductase [Bacteroidia bacterium]
MSAPRLHIHPQQKTDFDIIIVGGGLAGLVSAIMLSSKNKSVLLIEKKTYPFHKVCGEYVSNEVLEFLRTLGFDPFLHGASTIKKLRISAPSGKNIYADLPLGGFGISRFTMDAALLQIAKKNGAELLTARVTAINFKENIFEVFTNDDQRFTSRLVIGSYGKRDLLDKKLNRDFIQSHTHYMGVKYHVKTNYPVDEVGLDNFEGGYCGIVKIEEDQYNLCYLYKRNENFNFKTISELEEKVLFKNPVIKNLFINSNFLPGTNEIINEISFSRKKLVENHILMCGDSAGLITPLCGNGMSIAIHAAKILSELILRSGILDTIQHSEKIRIQLENDYLSLWQKQFSRRLFWGRTIQLFFGNTSVTKTALNVIHSIPSMERWLISKTHGKPISD